MPQAFMVCVQGGGKIITKRVSKTQYMRICYPKSGGSPIQGEMHMYKKVLKK